MKSTKHHANIIIALASIIVSIASAEIFFRCIKYDFTRAAWQAIPIFFRQPIVPVSPVFFRRPGPEEWRGQVLNTRARQLGVSPNPYADEKPVLVKYNANGFRNPEELTDWEIAVTGDSFTELGYLNYEDLFTTRLGAKLSLRVLNLGTSFTGPLTQLAYLEQYGISKSTKIAVIVFYEFNDITDLAREELSLLILKKTGKRRQRRFTPQSSLFTALQERLLQDKEPPQPIFNAWYKSVDSMVPIDVTNVPQRVEELTPEDKTNLHSFMEKYAAFGKAHNLKVALAYMPTKIRSLYGQLKFTESADPKVKDWRPTDLPKFIGRLCATNGIHFINLSPALSKRSKSVLTYNPIYDTHLNSEGSRVTSEVLAKEIKLILG